MAQPTVLDTWSIDDGEQQGPPPAKKNKQQQGGEQGGKHDEVEEVTQWAQEQIPKNNMVKWVPTPKGLIPFVLNPETDVLRCGEVRMKLFLRDGPGKTVLCIRGCAWNCPGHKSLECQCTCHLLQSHYDSRLY